MKTIFLGLSIAAIAIVSCNNSADQNNNHNHSMGDHNMADSQMNQHAGHTGIDGQHMGMMENESMDHVVSAYFNIKNALASDNSAEAASAGNAVAVAMQQVDITGLTAEQKRINAEVKDDVVEHGKHIADNGDKIAHQREHFETLSKDIYDMVKVFGTSKPMYYTHCPMYNKNKGANWLSEVKEINNPYLGKEMPNCGTVKEEIK